MGTGHQSASFLLIRCLLVILILFTGCVSRNHVPAGQEIRDALHQDYARQPEAYRAVYANGSPVCENNPLVPLLDAMQFRINEATVRLSFLELSQQAVGLYLLQPPEARASRGTVFFLHGYFNHPATFHDLYNFLLLNGYTVVSADLLGHGVSDGPRGEVTDFNEYALQVQAMLDWGHQQNLPEPWFGAGHSTGAAAMAIHAASTPEPVYKALFLGSPLGRTRLYRLSQFGERLIGSFVYAVKADWIDEFSVNYVPLCWVRALRAWVNSHQDFGNLDLPVTIAWAGNDDTLDLKYSVNFYQRINQQLTELYFPEGIHNLYHHQPAQQRLFTAMLEFFDLHSNP